MMVKLHNVSKTYIRNGRPIEVLKNVSFTVQQGESVCLTGHSGCGKTTLFNILGCLLPPTIGEYYFQTQNTGLLSDSELARIRADEIGFAFQDYKLIPDMTVLENILMPSMYGKKKSMNKETICSMAHHLELGNCLNAYTDQLSGGQKQRVALLRAIAKRPSLILADEPTGNLDQYSEMEVLRLLLELNKKGTTLLVITHSMDMVKYFGRHLQFQDGSVVECK